MSDNELKYFEPITEPAPPKNIVAYRLKINDGKAAGEEVVREIGQELNTIVAGMPKKTSLAINLGGVESIASATLGLLVTARTKLHNQSGKLHLVGVSRHIQEVLITTRLNDLMSSHEDMEALGQSLVKAGVNGPG